jgi:hypothetical protein
MSLNIYDVIFYEKDGEPDTIYVVLANTHLEAVGLAEVDRGWKLGRGEPRGARQADTVCLVGQSLTGARDPQIIHGPFLETGYSRGETWLFDDLTKTWLTHDDYHKPKSET